MLKTKLALCLLVAKKYKWLTDSYVLDFYVDNHWSKLPASWRQVLEQLPIEKLSELLQSQTNVSIVWPLELLALRQLLRTLCIGRLANIAQDELLPGCPVLEHVKLKHMFRKCVKPKKWHEITKMSAICAQSCKQLNVDYVVDFGAGVGHLARVLGFGYGINVCCLEMQAHLNAQAVTIDAKLECVAAKHLQGDDLANLRRPVHLTQRLSSTTQPAELMESIRAAFKLPNCNFKFGIIGLHPCGDLAPTLMRLFLNCPQAKFLHFASCCYQKMSNQGYPLSSSFELSYEAREIACHAAEQYEQRLSAGEYEYLKIHSFRAAAESIIAQHLPQLRHSALRNVKHAPGMSFHNYFERAIEGTALAELSGILYPAQIEKDLQYWQRIVCFYSLRLMLAPL
ncbi:CG2906, partial [Drosophila busckii]